MNMYIWRMTINVLFLVITILFLVSLMKIKRFIIKIDPKGEH